MIRQTCATNCGCQCDTMFCGCHDWADKPNSAVDPNAKRNDPSVAVAR